MESTNFFADLSKFMNEHLQSAQSTKIDYFDYTKKPSDLSWWYPVLAQDSRINQPKTKIVYMPLPEIFGCLDGVQDAKVTEFFANKHQYFEGFNFPCFIKTGVFSGKHNWKQCCFLNDISDFESHVIEIVSFQEMVMCPPTPTLAIRELLEVDTFVTLDSYNGMPLTEEWRFFYTDGKLSHVQFYWPTGSIREKSDQKTKEAIDFILQFTTVPEGALEQSQLAADALYRHDPSINWAIDVLKTKRGWFVTDVQKSEDSFDYDWLQDNPKAQLPDSIKSSS